MLSTAPAVGQEAIDDVRIQALARPEPGRLTLLVRVPLSAMRGIAWPAVGPLLDLSRVEPVLQDDASRWIDRRIDIFEAGRRLSPPRVAAARISLPSDTSFNSFDGALAHVTGPALPEATELVVNQALVDVALEYPIESSRSRFSTELRFAATGARTTTTLRLVRPDGVERTFALDGDRGVVRLEPRWFEAASLFLAEGFAYIFSRPEHLLFALCLVVPFRGLATIVPIAIAFMLAHSITLLALALDMARTALWFPSLVALLIAISIVYVALENIVSPAPQRRRILAFVFGAMHGFAFALAFAERQQFAGDHLLASLLSFNIGVSAGQVLVLALFVSVLRVVLRSPSAERMGTILLSAIVLHTAWHWTGERGAEIMRFPLRTPLLDAAFLAAVVQWLILAVVLAAAAWLTFGVLDRRAAVLRK